MREKVTTCLISQMVTCASALDEMAKDETGHTVIAELCSSISPTATPPLTNGMTATTKIKVKVSFTIKNVDLTDLSRDDHSSMTSNFEEKIAANAGVDKHQVTVTLIDGSIIVIAEILVDGEAQAAKVTLEMTKPEKKAELQAAIKASPVLKKVIEAKGKTVDDLEMSTPQTVYHATPTTRNPWPTDQPKATTIAIAVAEFAAPRAAAPFLTMVISAIALCA